MIQMHFVEYFTKPHNKPANVNASAAVPGVNFSDWYTTTIPATTQLTIQQSSMPNETICERGKVYFFPASSGIFWPVPGWDGYLLRVIYYLKQIMR